ncbi:hypothetical protein B0H13DRAFT_2655723 [Mycena leptocephala]|nr:hypothetical protein B0H13DRAFT_2655723 [Mycena leptocephala]
MQDWELRKEDAYPTVSPQRNKPPPAHDVVPGVNFTAGIAYGALYPCAYELYLLMNGVLGYNLPSPMNPTLGTLFVNKFSERFAVRWMHLVTGLWMKTRLAAYRVAP